MLDVLVLHTRLLHSPRYSLARPRVRARERLVVRRVAGDRGEGRGEVSGVSGFTVASFLARERNLDLLHEPRDLPRDLARDLERVLLRLPVPLDFFLGLAIYNINKDINIKHKKYN